MKKTAAVGVLSAVSGIVLLTLGLITGDDAQIQAGMASLGIMGAVALVAIKLLLTKVKLLEGQTPPKTEAAPVTDIKTAVDYANKRDGQ
jgi:hypothetical protein